MKHNKKIYSVIAGMLLICMLLPFYNKAQTITTYDRSAWTVTPSSQELISDAPNGAATKMLDGDKSTYWLSEITNNYAQYPHTLVFDMQVAQPVNQIYYVPRNNQGTSAYAGSLSFSDDGIAFGSEMPVIFFTGFSQHTINLSSTQNHRYFRLSITQNYQDHVHADGDAVTTMAEVGAAYNTSLEVSLASFTAQSQAGGVQLNWSTAYEINGASFNITRSADAVNFTTIGTVTSTGTPSTTASYSFTDASPLNGINFYRLELVHTSGPVETSIIKNSEFPLVNYSSTQSKNLNLFYFIPAGKAPWPDFKHRLDTIFLELQTYYKNEMNRNGRGNKTFGLVTDASHTQIKLLIVHGKHNFQYYSTNPGGGSAPAILAEVEEYMAANPSPYYGTHSQIISPAFNDVIDPNVGVVDEQVPVYGTLRICYSLDYTDLKWSLLGTGGTLGLAATVNIGGTAHEAGHGLNLEHNRTIQPGFGTALMSNGNSTFGISTTSLTATDAAILNHNEVFNPNGISYYGPNTASVSRVHTCYSATKNAIIVAGRIINNGSPVTDIGIYNDPNNGSSPGMGANKDYDAITFTAPIIGTDSFYVEMPITDFQITDSSLYELKILTIQQDGNTTYTFYHYDFANNLPELNDPAFSSISATITASAGANGSISSTGATVISCAGDQTYTFTADSGYAVDSVIIDGNAVTPAGTYTFTNVTAARTIRVTFIASTLPVDLVSFNALIQNNNNALLNWQTATEINNKGYEVEMAQANGTYTSMSFVTAKIVSSLQNNYQTVVSNLAPGIYYFRLKIVGTNGAYTYSPVKTITIKNAADNIRIYPNPTTNGFIYVDMPVNKKVMVTITNATGQEISNIGVAMYNSPLKIKLPAGGQYNIRVITTDGVIITRKLINLE